MSLLLAWVFLWTAPSTAFSQQPAGTGFVTTLGRDTIALESYRRTPARLDGDILLRAPRTVRYHYTFTYRPDGAIARSVVDLMYLDAASVPVNRTTMTFTGDSVRVDVDTGGVQGSVKRAVPRGTVPELMSGFGGEYGLYISLGMYEALISGLKSRVNDTSRVSVIGAASGQPGNKTLIRRSPTLVDVDYFGIEWTHLTVNANGQLGGADATGTTEKTRSVRTGPINIDSAAKEFVREDRAGKAFGISSPADSVRARVGGASIAINYSSPRKRGREVMGGLLPYGFVWRTGANAATVMTTNRFINIGGHSLPSGSYSLWTLPTRDGVQLVINSVSGQWGTDYTAAKDVVHLPMKVTRGLPVQEQFSITLPATGNSGELRLRWDDFLWTVPVSVP